jgi:hypothetical protein
MHAVVAVRGDCHRYRDDEGVAACLCCCIFVNWSMSAYLLHWHDADACVIQTMQPQCSRHKLN